VYLSFYFIPYLLLYSYSISLLPTKIIIYVLIHSSVSIDRYFILMFSSFYSGFVSFLFYFIYISISQFHFYVLTFYFHSILVLFHSYFYFYCTQFSPEFCVHFTKKMRPNGEELPKLCLCYIGRHN